MRNGKQQGPSDGKKWRTTRPVAKSILTPHPNGTATTESWLIISMQAYTAFPDFLILQEMMQCRSLNKISQFFFFYFGNHIRDPNTPSSYS